MAKPAILAVDDDPQVLPTVERDLRQHYGRDYRILKADSGQAAMEVLRQMKKRNDPLALMLVDQRMPGMMGIDFLEQAVREFPAAKRVLLTAYADTDAAIRAINVVDIDYYLLKPWQPPEEKLYPVLDDLLCKWKETYLPAFEGMRVVGHQWSPESHALKDFLARNLIAYRWLDVENPDQSREAASIVANAGHGESALPLVLYPDGSSEVSPDPGAIAAKVGLKTRAENRLYDIVIIGAGPAGLAAAVYCGSEGLRTLVVEREAPGGQAGTSSKIENYLGFPGGVSGRDLTARAVAQTRKFGVEILAPQRATRIEMKDLTKIVHLADGTNVAAHVVLLATGVAWRKLDIPGIENLTGAGVYYGAAMTEAQVCKDEDVYVVGGANSAGQAAAYFSQHARKVTMIVRGDGLGRGMSRYLVDRLAQTDKIAVRPRSNVAAVSGDGRLESITIADNDGKRETVAAKTLFIFIGARPETDWLDGFVRRDEAGFILAGPDLIEHGKRPPGWPLDRDPFLLETSAPGVLVVGDVRHGSTKRVASAVGEGAMATTFTHRFLRLHT